MNHRNYRAPMGAAIPKGHNKLEMLEMAVINIAQKESIACASIR